MSDLTHPWPRSVASQAIQCKPGQWTAGSGRMDNNSQLHTVIDKMHITNSLDSMKMNHEQPSRHK
jgi:hypothetical protein